MWKFIYPLRYFRLRNPEKTVLDLFPTLIIAIIITIPFCLLDGASFFRSNGLLDKFLNLAGALTGFYIAALVAAATFSHPDLDKTIKSGPVFLVERDIDGKSIQVALTRREFACTIFGYLSFLALILSIGSVVAVGLSTVRFHSLLGGYFFYVRSSAVFMYSLAMSHLVVVTSLGLYYLMDILYRHDRQVTSKKSNDRAA